MGGARLTGHENREQDPSLSLGMTNVGTQG